MAAEFPRVVAKFDYVARSNQELTFRAGQMMIVVDMLSDDWYQGELDSLIGLIPTTYVEHVHNWRAAETPTTSTDDMAVVALQQHTHHARMASKRSVRVQPHASPPEQSVTQSVEYQHHEPSPSPQHHRPTPSPQQEIEPQPVSPPKPKPTAAMTREERIRHYGGVQMPGFGGGGYQPPDETSDGANSNHDDDTTLIQPMPLRRQPDAPDLAKALNMRNQAARGGPTKTSGTNELNRAMQMIKTKTMYESRGLTSQELELKQRLKLQSTKLNEATSRQPKTELQMQMARLAKTQPIS
eukprot:m.64541 g.64541  ORF g.64541 m.64541 type:complete len:297 (-) comp23444_c0_seq1:48-938(-)